MADLRKSKFVPNMTYLEGYNAKVYINPNFNRHNASYNRTVPNNAAMHVNPKFSHLITNVHNTCNKTKIYVNPNFIKPNNNVADSFCSSTRVNKEDSVPEIINKTNYETGLPSATTGYKPINNIQTHLPAPITKSRYSLVRQHTAREPRGSVTPEQSKNTFKINKYKSVQWKDIKQNLDCTVSKRINSVPKSGYFVEKQLKSQKTDSCLPKSCDSINRYKLVNHINKLPVINNTVKIKPFALTKAWTDPHKKVFRLNRSLIRTKKINKKGNLKKNNIPCPLFRKFGKCLRNNRGYCEFLHDQKHVSVCRKFIKGICHDTECLLSHELTLQKMPTCYFYLQGTCLKVGCPYLHVKLNENAKICPDFLKGYCEKGSKCLHRHVNVQLQNRKGTLQSKKYASKVIRDNVRVVDHKDGAMKRSAIQNNETTLVTDYRYYQENKKDEDKSTYDIVYEVMKPIRCKLGTLPSFIQL